MSQINTNAILDASGGTTATVNGFTPTVSNMAGRNRIINGDMRIDQRNAGASVTITTDGQYTLDRFDVKSSVSSKLTAQQNAGSVTPADGFPKYLGLTSTSAYSVGATEYFYLEQRIEAYNTNDLMWGTAGAKTVTLSFWVYSSLTGTFGGSIFNGAANRSYPYTYTVSSANTWTKVSVTIPGDTSGTWAGTNGIGMFVSFGLGVGTSNSGTPGAWSGTLYRSATGATSVVGTSGATFYITGVQLEEGSVATPFEHRQYGQELALCQRYYWNIGPILESFQGFVAVGSTGGDVYVRYPVPMRSAPAITYTSLSDYFVFIWNSSIGKTLTGITLLYANTIKGVLGVNWSGASGTAGTGLSLDIKNTEVLQFSSEL